MPGIHCLRINTQPPLACSKDRPTATNPSTTPSPKGRTRPRPRPYITQDEHHTQRRHTVALLRRCFAGARARARPCGWTGRNDVYLPRRRTRCNSGILLNVGYWFEAVGLRQAGGARQASMMGLRDHPLRCLRRHHYLHRQARSLRPVPCGYRAHSNCPHPRQRA